MFLVLNGLILLFGEWVRRRADGPPRVAAARDQRRRRSPRSTPWSSARQARSASPRCSRCCPGSAARGSRWWPGWPAASTTRTRRASRFLLATPIILAAGVYKLPDLLGPNGDGVRPQILVGSIAAVVAAYLSVRFLTRWFATRTLLPFAIYSLAVGLFAIVRFV